jgi:hypothetical protein
MVKKRGAPKTASGTASRRVFVLPKRRADLWNIEDGRHIGEHAGGEELGKLEERSPAPDPDIAMEAPERRRRRLSNFGLTGGRVALELAKQEKPV